MPTPSRRGFVTDAMSVGPGAWVAGPAREQPGEHLADLEPAASTAIGNIDVSVSPGETFTSRKWTVAVGGDDRVGAGQVGEPEGLVHPDGEVGGARRRSRRRPGPGEWYSVMPGV